MTELHDLPTVSSVPIRVEPRPDAAPAPPVSETEQRRPRKAASRPKRVSVVVLIGSALAGLVLVTYFVWLTVQMGAHSQTGAAPMIATFAAIGLGVGAGVLALAVGRMRR